MPHRQYWQVASRADHCCEYCLAPEEISPDRFEVEHIRPRVGGGSDDLGNLALSCSLCNSRKARATQALDPASWTVVPLFNPRQDEWEDHFRMHSALGGIVIVGLTPTGRATVERLAMNDAHAVHARGLWSLLGLFPP
jgi:hypothetical protein